MQKEYEHQNHWFEQYLGGVRKKPMLSEQDDFPNLHSQNKPPLQNSIISRMPLKLAPQGLLKRFKTAYIWILLLIPIIYHYT